MVSDVMWLLGDRAYDSICSMGCPWCIAVGGACAGSIWDDGIQVSRLSIDEVKLLSFQYGLSFGLGMFGCDVLCYGWEKGLDKPIQSDPIVKLDLTQTTTLPPLMDVVSYMGGSVLVVG